MSTRKGAMSTRNGNASYGSGRQLNQVYSNRGLDGVERCDLSPGDIVLVATRNSTYVMVQLSDGEFLVSGGWFSHNEWTQSPAKVAVAGCRLRHGKYPLTDKWIAVRDARIEFGNGLVTSEVVSVCVLRNWMLSQFPLKLYRELVLNDMMPRRRDS